MGALWRGIRIRFSHRPIETAGPGGRIIYAFTSVRRAVLVRELPCAVLQLGLNIVVGIASLIARRSVAVFVFLVCLGSLVQQLMRIPRFGPKAGAHAGSELRIALVGTQHRTAFENVDELVLPAVAVPKRGNGAWREPRQVDAEIAQAEDFAQLPLFPAGHARGERFWVEEKKEAKGDFVCVNGDCMLQGAHVICLRWR